MKGQRRSDTLDLEDPALKKRKLDVQPFFDFCGFAKSYSVMEDLLMYHPEKYGRGERELIRFISPATVAPDDSPISCHYKLLSSSAAKWTAGNLPPWSYQSITVDGESVLKTAGAKRHGQNTHLDLSTIKELMKPASFGSGNKTVFDENVRKASEIKASRIEVGTSQTYLDDIQKMAPRGKKFVVKLYKMHIYEEGGKFDRHVDTVHAPNHYATLVVCLPNVYEGGEFVLEVDGQDHTIELGSYPKQLFNRLKADYSYVLFLTDLPHQINPVTGGTRVVLQYDVFVEDLECDEPAPKPIAKEYKGNNTSYFEKDETTCCLVSDPKQAQEDPQILVDLLAKYIAENPATKICFLLTQRYPLALSVNNLKSGDRILFDLLVPLYEVELGYDVNPTVTDYEGNYRSTEIPYDTLNVMTYEDTRSLAEYLADSNQLPAERDEDREEDEPGPKKSPCVVFVGNSAKFHEVFHTDYSEWTGNEAQLGENVYASAVLSIGPRKVNK